MHPFFAGGFNKCIFLLDQSVFMVKHCNQRKEKAMKPIRIILVILFILFCQTQVYAAPKSDLWEFWLAFDASSTQPVDHQLWDHFLNTYVQQGNQGINRIAYGQVTPSDRKTLETYLNSLQKVPVAGLNRDEQKAFWINLYNALTVKLIIDHYPVKTIRDIDISPGLFADGPWRKKLVRISGQPVSLDDIEHRILRPIWNDPRIHYAVNCASVGCPNLQPRAFTTLNTEELLEKGSREYINHPRGARVDKGKLLVSSIYKWFKSDFGGKPEGIIAHLKNYAEDPLKKDLIQITKISGYDYDWSLNDAPNR
jgi:hypothetical protein